MLPHGYEQPAAIVLLLAGVLAFERGDRRVEHRRHVEFAEEREGSSEWFVRSERLDAHIDVLAGGVDPWDRWRRWVAEAIAVR